MATSSSASKVAKLAQKGKGKKVRFQGGTVFPAVIVGVVVLLLPLIVYARETRPGPGEGEPTVDQHWHASFGIQVCDPIGPTTKELGKLVGALEEEGTDGFNKYQRTGVHSHGDGVMHWHAFTGAATGTNAKLKVFLDNYGIKLSNDKLTMPADQGGEVFEEGKSKCVLDGKEKDASLKLWVWNSFSNVDEDPAVYTNNMTNVRLINDGMVFVIAFVPDDVDPVPPVDVARLPELGAIDGGSTEISQDTVPTGDSTVASDSASTDSSVVTGETAVTTAVSTAGSTATTDS